MTNEIVLDLITIGVCFVVLCYVIKDLTEWEP